MAEESEREQQAVMAGMGETRSAADLRRLRESRDAQMTDALSRAGQEVARQQMARKEAEKRELNQLQAYQQENLRNPHKSHKWFSGSNGRYVWSKCCC